MTSATIYQEIAQRTGGDIYLGVVGPVRTGKSTLIKRFLEQLILPNIDDPYRRQRAQDELPQSGSGKTIMTAEPKFIPEEAVTVSPDGTAQLSVRMIDSVGYLIPNAAGATEDGQTRMVTTPWADHEIPLTEAAELGTKKVIAEHCTAGIVVTTDGSVTEFDRADYLEAERRAITDLQATGKPFVVIINSAAPEGSEAPVSYTHLDHSVVQLMVRRGEITEEEARTYPGKNLITRAVGTEPRVSCDVFTLRVAPGDAILLCSDGLSNLLTDQELLFEVVHAVHKEQCCQHLIEIAKDRGAPDKMCIRDRAKPASFWGPAPRSLPRWSRWAC